MRMPGMPPQMPLEELQRSLTRIIETAPSLPENGPIPPDVMKWAGDASALIGATNDFALVPEAQVAINGFSFADRLGNQGPNPTDPALEPKERRKETLSCRNCCP